MSIKIWHQSFTTLARVPEYNQVLREHIGKVVRADTVVDEEFIQVPFSIARHQSLQHARGI